LRKERGQEDVEEEVEQGEDMLLLLRVKALVKFETKSEG
jgi:hypothetical protein